MIPRGLKFVARCAVLSGRCLVLSAECLVLGADCLVLGARCSVLGARCLVLGAWCLALGAGCWVPGSSSVVYAQAPVTNAKVDMRSAAQGVDRVVQSVAATRMPAWIGYRLAAAPGTRRTCGGNGSRVLLEPPSEFYVLARMEAGEIVRLRSFTPECDIDAGGLPLVWLTDLKPADGVAWLVQMARASKDLTIKKAAVSALTRSGDPSATKFFEELLTGK
jgi:hypothetical protein